MSQQWLEWTKELQALAQSGRTYTKSDFDRERYDRINQIAAEIAAVHTNQKQEFIRDLYLFETGYATPKVDVRGVVFREDKILLVQEASDRGWTLPGGWADVGDTPAEATEREIFEESGFTAKTKKVLAVWDRERQGHTPNPFAIYKIFLLCELTGGEAKPSAETLDVRFFGEDELDDLTLSQGRTLLPQLKRFYEHHRNPDWPADFN